MDKSALLADRVSLNTGTVDIEGVGTITVRGLSRFELLVAQKTYPDDTLKQERFILAAAMLDPKMGEGDIAEWQRTSLPMEINAVATRVNELSGIAQGSAKEAYKSAGDD